MAVAPVWITGSGLRAVRSASHPDCRPCARPEVRCRRAERRTCASSRAASTPSGGIPCTDLSDRRKPRRTLAASSSEPTSLVNTKRRPPRTWTGAAASPDVVDALAASRPPGLAARACVGTSPSSCRRPCEPSATPPRGAAPGATHSCSGPRCTCSTPQRAKLLRPGAGGAADDEVAVERVLHRLGQDVAGLLSGQRPRRDHVGLTEISVLLLHRRVVRGGQAEREPVLDRRPHGEALRELHEPALSLAADASGRPAPLDSPEHPRPPENNSGPNQPARGLPRGAEGS